MLVFFHNRPKSETPPVSTNNKFIFKSIVYSDKRIFYSNKNEQNTD